MDIRQVGTGACTGQGPSPALQAQQHVGDAGLRLGMEQSKMEKGGNIQGAKKSPSGAFSIAQPAAQPHDLGRPQTGILLLGAAGCSLAQSSLHLGTDGCVWDGSEPPPLQAEPLSSPRIPVHPPFSSLHSHAELTEEGRDGSNGGGRSGTLPFLLPFHIALKVGPGAWGGGLCN